MTPEIRATPHASGRRIDVQVQLERRLPAAGAPPRPALRIVRRRGGHPTGPMDGVVVAELPDLFETDVDPWMRLETLRFHTDATPTGDGTIEAEATLFHDAPQPSEPVMLRVRAFDPALQSVVEWVFAEGTRLVRTLGATPGWARDLVLEFFHTPGGGPEVSAGVLEILEDNANPAIANRLEWTPAGGVSRTIEFDSVVHRKLDLTDAAAFTFESRDAATPDTEPGTAWLVLERTLDDDAGRVRWTLALGDRELAPLTHYYYTVYDLDSGDSLGRGVAIASRDFDSARLLFHRLPGAYQRADEPDPTQPTGAPGPLRRFLAPVGETADLARSIAEGVRDRHDVQSARADLLPHLARMIGWAPDLTAPTELQRRDILAAPEIFGTVGTAPNVAALVNRVTGWPCRTKEFVNNIFLTNAPERVRLWELWDLRNDGTQWTAPAQLTLTNDVDARPALATDGAGVVWLFWESDRGGRRELWRQRLDGVDAAPVRARLGASDDAADFTATDESPAVAWDGSRMWCFWSSDREGQWDIWGRTYDAAASAGDPLRLTEHPAADQTPAVVLVPGAPDRLWLFWSSRRRGPADIWSRVLDTSTGVWSDAARVTESPLCDHHPAAAVDASGRLWLFWTREAGGRQTLWYRIHDGTSWTDPADAELDLGHARDEAPAVVAWNLGVFLLWHSDHDGAWRIWGRDHDGTAWGPAHRLSRSPAGHKEPAAVIDAAGDMRVVWRSQRRARRYRSRTLDLDDSTMLDPMGTFHDYVHYTYDTGRSEADWYDRGTVGLYVTPDTAVTSEIDAGVARLRTFVEPFRAVPVRYVWQPDDPSVVEALGADGMPAEEWSDELV